MTSFLSLAQRAILAHAKWCRKSYGLGLISPSRLSPAASHIFLKLNGIDDADMILPLGPGKKYSRLGKQFLSLAFLLRKHRKDGRQKFAG